MINVRVFSSKIMGANCYLVYDGLNSIVIDPCVDYNFISKYIKGDLKGVFITHGHFDHIECLDSYLKANDNLLIYLHKNCVRKLSKKELNLSVMGYYPVELNIDSKNIRVIGNEVIDNVFDNVNIISFEVLGHSDCSLVYVINDLMFTGDFIFKRSIGRTDLPSGNNNLMNVYLNKFKKLEFDKVTINKENYLIYPGHGNNTTYNEEMEYNPYLKMKYE